MQCSGTTLSKLQCSGTTLSKLQCSGTMLSKLQCSGITLSKLQCSGISLKTVVFRYHSLKTVVFRYHTLKTVVFRYHTLKTHYNIGHKFIPLPHFMNRSVCAALKSSLTGTLAGLVGSYCKVQTAYQSYLQGSSSPRRMLICEDGTNWPSQNISN